MVYAILRWSQINTFVLLAQRRGPLTHGYLFHSIVVFFTGMRNDLCSVKHVNLLLGRVMGHCTKSQTSSHYLSSRQNAEDTSGIGPGKL